MATQLNNQPLRPRTSFEPEQVGLQANNSTASRDTAPLLTVGRYAPLVPSQYLFASTGAKTQRWMQTASGYRVNQEIDELQSERAEVADLPTATARTVENDSPAPSNAWHNAMRQFFKIRGDAVERSERTTENVEKSFDKTTALPTLNPALTLAKVDIEAATSRTTLFGVADRCPSMEQVRQTVSSAMTQLSACKLLLEQQQEAVDARTKSLLHAALLSVFQETGNALDRNSPEAVKADTKRAVRKLIDEKVVPPFETRPGPNPVDPLQWIKDNISPKLDPDMQPYAVQLETYSWLNPAASKIPGQSRKAAEHRQHSLYRVLARRLKTFVR